MVEHGTVAQGWAVVERGRLLVSTVSPSAVGAMVNWLVVRELMMVMDSATDGLIERAFMSATKDRDAALIQVTIAAKE